VLEAGRRLVLGESRGLLPWQMELLGNGLAIYVDPVSYQPCSMGNDVAC